MQRRPRRAAKGRDQIHEIRILRRPLVRLPGAHGPPEHGAYMPDTQVLRHELVLRAYVIVEQNIRERSKIRSITRGRGLAVPEEGGDDDEVAGRVQRFVCADEPFVVGDEAGVPSGIDDSWVLGVAEGLECDVSLGDMAAGFEGEVAEGIGLVGMRHQDCCY